MSAFIEQLNHALHSTLFEDMEKAMIRATAPARVGMIEGKRYLRITYNKDKSVASTTSVGIFVRKYRMGSGDGMTYHTEFKDDDGKILTFNEEMWGNIDDTPATYSELNE